MFARLRPLGILAVIAVMGTASAQVQISIGVRETGFAGGAAFSAIGADGGFSGGIEWINLDAQTLTLDGTWQKFTFNLTTDPISSFAGSTANGVLEGSYGTLEHVRVLNANGRTEPMTLHIDDVSNTITPMGGSPVTTVFGDFQGFMQGDEVMFQEPDFSGSTSGHVAMGSSTGVDNFVASRSASDRFDFQFVDGMTTRWVRLTTFQANNIPNPQIHFDQQSVIEFWMKGGDCQENLGGQGPGLAIAELCGVGLNIGESSTYDVANAPAGAPGAFALSRANQPDFPFFGGTLVSGTGLFLGVSIFADGQGRASFPIPGSGRMTDLVVQSVFIDPSTPMGLAFTNAILARTGR